ncbi:MAG: beta-galactosidase [Anaerolineae bacterium]|nr:beta-galactosidase [Anaerolineae bacterium]
MSSCWAIRVSLMVILLIIPQTSKSMPVSARAEVSSRLHMPIVMRDFDASWRSPVGIAMYGSVNDAAGLAKMKDAGAKWVVTMLHWRAIEPQEGERNWAVFDEKVRNAQAAGMQVFVLFLDNPSWAAPHRDGPVTDTQDLLNFLAAAVERYDGDGTDDAPGSPRVSVWSFYAEPDADSDNYSFKGRWGSRPREYAEMLKQAAQIIREKDPRAWVTNGGLAYDWFKEEGGPFVRSFLTDTLRALNEMGGAGRFLDAIAVHYYPIAAHRWPTLREKVQEIRSIMARHGVGELPIVIPEMGYWSEHVPQAPALSSDEDQQARRLVQMFVWGWAERVPLMAWFAVFDDGPGTEAHGLFRGRDLNQPKPAYYAYRTLTQELSHARLLRSLTVSGVEGYVFRMANGVEKTVLWGTSAQAVGVDFPYSCLRLVNYKGERFEPILDGDRNWDWDMASNGQIRLGIFPEVPFFVMPCQSYH